ncbi:hypothetical protein [Streptomyces sp. NPDC045251]|uniref:hypothetical protein n=1 Tax=unclassified Streptomyces TaxID=2593676 RepID=UPI0033E72276
MSLGSERAPVAPLAGGQVGDDGAADGRNQGRRHDHGPIGADQWRGTVGGTL